MTFLTEPQRRTVFDKVISLVDTKFSGADVDVSQLRDVHGPRVVGSRTLEDFEQALDGLLRDLKTSTQDSSTRRGHVPPAESRWPQR